MAYLLIDKRGEQNLKQDDMLASKRFVVERKPDLINFYELEEAVVLDVILDEEHPEVKKSKIDPENYPENIDGSKPNPIDNNYSLIGRIKFRFLNSQINLEKSFLDWALPMENTGVVEYPLMNEIVIIGKYRGKYFYSKKLNTNSLINSNAQFYAERVAGRVNKNINEYDSDGNYDGPKSKMNYTGGPDYTGVLGNYFKFNPKIRTLRAYEGDTIIQSRFGSSIRFGTYDHNPNNNDGIGEYSDGGGNPMILIRNRQAPIESKQGFTAKGYTVEDVNKDGASIQMTSGKTVSAIMPQTSTQITSGRTAAKIPVFKGDQIVITSDRLVFSSRSNEIYLFSKKDMGIATDAEFMVSAGKKITITTPDIFTINARQIFLGNHAVTGQPALLGRTTILWLKSMVDVLLTSINSQILVYKGLITHAPLHFPPGASKAAMIPIVTVWTAQIVSLTACQASLQGLKMKLSSLLSSRVFLTPGD